MAYRIVKINSRCKLETQLNYLVCRTDKETRVLLDEISILIIENQQACLTSALISELMNHKVRVIFCDSQHSPQGELNPYSSCFDTYSKIKAQVNWPRNFMDNLWKKVVQLKIRNQAMLLHLTEHEAEAKTLQGYQEQVEDGDPTNREGLAAKVYFAALFGSSFDRRKDSDSRNTYLNYGYSLILSAVNREISLFGYMPVWGIHHIGAQNPFNLGCDLMEPFRPFIDQMVVSGVLSPENYKKMLLDRMGQNILCTENNTILENAIHFFVLGCFNALDQGDTTHVPDVGFLHE